MTTKRKSQILSAVQVQAVKKPGMYGDGGTLYLRVDEFGTKRWVQRITIDGKRHNLGLGGYPAVTLAQARQAAQDNARTVREGRDPLAEKRGVVQATRKPVTSTFAEAATIVVDMRRPTWSNE